MKQNEFAAKISEHRDSLYRIAFMYLRSEAKALEAVDEAVFKALLTLHKLRRSNYFFTWMCRILINRCRQEIKQQKAAAHSDKIGLSPSAEISALPLGEALSHLPRELKEPVILFYFAKLSTAEIAYTLKISKGAGSARLRRGVSLLGLELAQEEKVI